MKLWIVRARDGHDVWNPWYDKAFGFVVRAGTEEEARTLASFVHGAEGREPWLDATASTCEELTGDGAAEVVMADVHNA